MVARSSLEAANSGRVRLEKICKIIHESQFGIHDISRTELDDQNQLPRLNMPFELGLFLGAHQFGSKEQLKKSCLILDSEQYRYQKFLSDIAGQDIKAHSNQALEVIPVVRDWLYTESKVYTGKIPGGKVMQERYEKFSSDLPGICAAYQLQIRELTFKDFSDIVSIWSRQEPISN